MKIDLAGPERRGLAMGLNEFAGYLAVALSALATGHVAAAYGLRPQPFYPGVAFVLVGLGLSAVLVRETHGHARHEARNQAPHETTPSQRQVFVRTSFTDRALSSVSQAGLVNDGMAWGLFPLFFARAGMSLDQIGWLAAIYPGVRRRDLRVGDARRGTGARGEARSRLARAGVPARPRSRVRLDLRPLPQEADAGMARDVSRMLRGPVCETVQSAQDRAQARVVIVNCRCGRQGIHGVIPRAGPVRERDAPYGLRS